MEATEAKLSIKTNELKELQEVVNKINQAQLEVGQIETRKHMLLHSLATVQDELKAIQDKLEAEYGKVSINIQDGTYEPIKEDEQQANT
jgi:hypothetical protein